MAHIQLQTGDIMNQLRFRLVDVCKSMMSMFWCGSPDRYGSLWIAMDWSAVIVNAAVGHTFAMMMRMRRTWWHDFGICQQQTVSAKLNPWPTGSENVMQTAQIGFCRVRNCKKELVFGDRQDSHTEHCRFECESSILPGAFFAVLGYLIFGPGLINWMNFDVKWEEQDDMYEY